MEKVALKRIGIKFSDIVVVAVIGFFIFKILEKHIPQDLIL